MKRTAVLCLSLLLLFAWARAFALQPVEELGKSIFFDENLSANRNQACSSCHGPAAGWTGPDASINAGGAVYEGSVAGLFGNRKPPSAAYATVSPILHVVGQKRNTTFIGGNFWDGRATGQRLGSPSAEQAQGPFLNPLEHALADSKVVVTRICASTYRELFKEVCGPDACDQSDLGGVYDCVGRSIAGYESSSEVNQYSSKYDAYLAGKTDLTKQEEQGLNLFKSNGKCANCHVLDRGPKGDVPPLLTDFGYDNLGVPRNPDNPFFSELTLSLQGYAWIDLGLGGLLASKVEYQHLALANNGKMKVPTLRNVDKWDSTLGPQVKAYMHNGYFKTLWQVVHFYNTRDAKPVCEDNFARIEEALAQDCWPRAEVQVNLNREDLGNLHLTRAQEDAIVAFLKTLSDGFAP